ncbi:MAG: amino acid adenylation domain-containing protein, partial [Ktedonobacteraceae bacterium]
QARIQQTGVPIGRPIGNTQLYLLDAHLEPAPPGAPGELYIGGVGIARGYLHRPDLTAERFMPHPFSSTPGARLYRTGDLARYLPDGAIEFLGRADSQVKIRGFRVELGEIEAALSQHESVQENVTLAQEGAHGDKRLVAYVVARPGRQVSAGELQVFLRELLPEYMIPATMLFLDTLPLLPGGKLDRRALLELAAPHEGEARSSAPARDLVEEMLAGIWSRTLDVEQVGIHDDFFALGGHSLLAIQVIARIRGAFGVELPLRALMQSPTIARLAEHIRVARQDEPEGVIPPLLPALRVGNAPLSYAQQRQWFLDQLDPGNARANVFGAVRLRGPLQVEALEQSIQAVARRHEILRTTFAVVADEDEPVQIVAPELALSLAVIDLQAAPEAGREAEALRLVIAEEQRPFDLARGPLLRVTLLRLAEEEHLLLLTSHHIIFDGWSINVFLRELAALYKACAQGEAPALPELPVQYTDYARWQRQWLRGDRLDALLAWWKQRLADPPVLLLPTDRPRPAFWHDHAATLPLVLPERLTSALKELSRREGVTLFMTLLAAFQCVLARYSGQQDIVVGSPVANRRWAELEGLIGCFINTLILRIDLSGNPTFRELLSRVREVALDAYAHQDAPVEKLVEELQSRRDLSRNPLFQALFALQNDPREQVNLPALAPSFLRVESETTTVDLDLTLWEKGEELVGGFKYSSALFDEPIIQHIKEDWLALLELVAADPAQHIADLPLLSSAEQQQLLEEWNATEADYARDRCIHELFEAKVERTPAAVAVVFGEECLTYAQVNAQANQLAYHLHAIDAGPGAAVAVYMERSLEMIPALLGILKAGGAYVPLETSFPAARIQWILSSLHIRTLITQSKLLVTLQESQLADLENIICLDQDFSHEALEWMSEQRVWTRADLDTLPMENLPRQSGPDDLAYIIFTSGSTGTPKGVMVRHRPVINLIEWVNRTFAVNAADRVLFITSLCFDLSVYDIFGLLAAGGSIQVVPGPDLKEPERLLELLRDAPITFWDSAPAALQQLVPFFAPSPTRASSRTSKLRLIFLSGDWIPLKLPDAAREQFPCAEVVSLGGATEATVWSNFYCVQEVAAHWSSIPYGKPIQNARYYILDPYLYPCPIGVTGDLCIGGECLASGYANDPALTAQKFLPDPFTARSGMRLYKTGDRARFWSNGTIEFLGRADTQVKIRGFRVELGEIEAALARHPAVQVAVVEAQAGASGEKRLAAYVVARVGYELSSRELRRYLQEQLPEYMVPAAFVLLDALPVTANGKVDRRKLPALDEYLPPGQEEIYVAPTTPVEERMVELWAEVLHLRRVGIHDNFFEIGGHSLLSVQLIARVRAAWSINLPLRSLFEAPTAAGLAAQVEQALTQPSPAAVSQPPTLDLQVEAALDPTIVPLEPYSIPDAEPASIFLTGATGFLGTVLLAELLQQTTADIYCLVRCSSIEDGRRKLQHALESALLWQPAYSNRIIPVRGDLEQPLLGMARDVFEQLAAKLDVIYHSGTLVNTVYAYHDLKATNVLGTQEVLRLAASRKVKPLHYVSTLSVFSPAAVAPGQLIDEEEALDAHRDYLHEGYEQSKWVAEKLVVGARARGLPVAIYRPGRVTGHSQTGAWGTDDVLCRMIKGCVQLGSIPTIVSEDRLEMTPVDYVGRALVALSRQKESLGKVFHLHNPTSVVVGELVARVNEAGYPVRQVAYPAWHAALERSAGQAAENTLASFLSLFPQRIEEDQARHSEPQPRVIFGSTNSLHGLANTSITCPPVDAQLIATYLSYFVRVGFLPEPS